MEEGSLFEASVPAVSVVIAALAGEVTDFARAELISLLEFLVSGESHYRELEHCRGDLGEECRSVARDGIWVILRYVFGREREDVSNILLMIDADVSRRQYYAEFANNPKKAETLSSLVSLPICRHIPATSERQLAWRAG